jgi:sugar porter (SP) family MFS transporter
LALRDGYTHGVLTCACSIISGIIATPWWLEQFATTGRDPTSAVKALTAAQTAEVVSILSAGTFFGALAAAPSADQLGRRRALMIAVGVFSIGVTVQVVSMSLPTYVAGRFVAGIGVGMISVIVPLYQSEMAPKWVRGALVCAYQLAITLGLLVAAIVEYFTHSIDGPASFQIPVALQYVWAAILLLGMIVLPETPRYLIKRGLHAEAAASLSRIRRLDITHPALIEEIAEIEANHAYEISLGPSTYKDAFTGSPHLGRRLLTGCGLFMLQQLSGCNFIFYFGNSFFKEVIGSSGFLFQVISNCVNVGGTIPGIVFVESLGRRRLLMLGAVGMAICQLIVASIGSVHTIDSQTSNKIFTGFICVYLFCFASTWGPVCWVVSAEIFPLKVRAKSMSIATSSNWLLNFLIAYTTPYLLGTGPGALSLGPKIFFVWGACCIVAFFFVWFMVYETSKLTLEQIDEMYERVGHAWESKSFEPTWSFQTMRQETEANSNSNSNSNSTAMNAAEGGGEELRQRTPTAGSDATAGDTVRTSGELVASSPSTTNSAKHVTDEDKIIANLGNIDFSL